MRAMKDSGIEWIGQIPQEWDIVKIKHILDDSEFGIKIGPFGSALTNRKKSDGSINVYSQANIISGSFVSATHTIDEGSFDVLKGYEVKPGDVCVSMMGTIGKCCVVPDTISTGIMDSHLIKIRLNEDAVDNQFFAYVYDKDNGGICFSQIQHDKRGTIMDGLNTAIVRNLVFPLPPLACQKRISTYLNEKCAEIDALIAAKEKTNTLLKERRQSIIYEAVTKGLNPDSPMKDSGVEWIGQIPEHWAVERLKPHIDFNPKTVIPEYEEDDSVSFIPMDCLRRGTHTTQTVDYSKVKSGYVVFADGDILMAKVTPCLENGNLAVAGNLSDGVGFGSTEINVIRCKSIHREYLFYILQCKTYVDRAVADMYGVAGLKRLNPSFIPNTKYPMPSIEEQQAVASYLENTCGEIDKLVIANEKTIEKLKEYRQSIIYEAVTGKIEV